MLWLLLLPIDILLVVFFSDTLPIVLVVTLYLIGACIVCRALFVIFRFAVLAAFDL
jgi:hypothetical protein